MTSAQTTNNGEGARAARARVRRHWWTIALASLAAIGVGLVLILGKTAPGQVEPGYAIAAVIAMAALLPLAVHYVRRNQDEVDRLNELRANSFGLQVCLFAGWCWLVLSTGGVVPSPNVLVLIVATMLVTLGRYWMLKSRG